MSELSLVEEATLSRQPLDLQIVPDILLCSLQIQKAASNFGTK